MKRTVAAQTRLANADRDWAIYLVEERRAEIARAAVDHREGWHVGRSAEDVHCEDCRRPSGDMPLFPTMSRSAYLVRNIEFVTARMRLDADIAIFERGL